MKRFERELVPITESAASLMYRELENAYLEASEEVAKARTVQADAFLRYRLVAGTAKTDTQAEMQAISETSSYLDVALAKQEIARRRLMA